MKLSVLPHSFDFVHNFVRTFIAITILIRGGLTQTRTKSQIPVIVLIWHQPIANENTDNPAKVPLINADATT